MNLAKIHANLHHVDPTHSVALKTIVQCVSVWLECLGLLQTAVLSVIFIKTVHLTELAFNKDVKILALDHVDSMLCVESIIINQYALALMAMKEILTLDAMFAKVSQRIRIVISSFFPGFCKCYFKIFNVCVILLDHPIEIYQPCNPSPCGSNALCNEQNGAGSCTCMKNYHGDPYISCRPECIQNSDCEKTKSCVNTKCVNPCLGVCGMNAECRVQSHSPYCTCFPGHEGDARQICRKVEISKFYRLFSNNFFFKNHVFFQNSENEEHMNPCVLSPCGPNSICRVSDNRAVCSCQVNYFGAPPNCRVECMVNSDCTRDKACKNAKCLDPCLGTCGQHAICRVVNHSPICTCSSGYVGDPFEKCQIESKLGFCES
jgi:hypothetical protein